MIVGPTGGGKTTSYQILQEAMNTLHEQDPESYRQIKTKVLNPKSISMGELYGQENPDTKEWTDGLASKIMRKFAGAQD
jgi:dynein heavy chain, axonemal